MTVLSPQAQWALNDQPFCLWSCAANWAELKAVYSLREILNVQGI